MRRGARSSTGSPTTASGPTREPACWSTGSRPRLRGRWSRLITRPTGALQPTTNYVNAQVAPRSRRSIWLIPVVYEARGFLEESWLSRMGATPVEAGDRYWRRGPSRRPFACGARPPSSLLSETMRADILGRGEISPDRVSVIPNAVDSTASRRLRDEASPGWASSRTWPSSATSRASTVYEGIGYLLEAASRSSASARVAVSACCWSAMARTGPDSTASRRTWAAGRWRGHSHRPCPA